MSLGARIRDLFTRDAAPEIRVHVVIKGRIGEGWQDVDRHVTLPAGGTLRALLDEAERRGISLRDAIANSPHLRHTLMLNGERCPVDENLDRALSDGDQVYLLAPLAGG
jgi:molybdopterin converting factor small subunit